MRPAQHRARLGKLEAEARRAQHRQATGQVLSSPIPVTVQQVCGTAPMTEADEARLRAWMLEHGWTEDEDGTLIRGDR